MADGRQNRASEGVVTVRFPRTDFPQQGWIRKATGSADALFEAANAYGWYSASQSYRPYERTQNYGAYGNKIRSNRDFYQTEPQQGWIRKPTVNNLTTDFYEALTDFGWYGATQAYRSYERTQKYGAYGNKIRSNRDFYQTSPNQGWQAKPVLSLYEAYTGFGWYKPTQDFRSTDKLIKYGKRTLNQHPYYQTSPLDFGWYPTIPIAFDPAVGDWYIHETMTGLRRNVRWRPTEPLERPEDPNQFLGELHGWADPVDPAIKPSFNRSRFRVTEPLARPNNPNEFLGELHAWSDPVDPRTPRAKNFWRPTEPAQISWLLDAPDALSKTFSWTNPVQPRTTITRRWPQAWGDQATATWQPNFAFDPSLYASFSMYSDSRMGKRSGISMLGHSFYDMSWLKDVLSLTDGVTVDEYLFYYHYRRRRTLDAIAKKKAIAKRHRRRRI